MIREENKEKKTKELTSGEHRVTAVLASGGIRRFTTKPQSQ